MTSYDLLSRTTTTTYIATAAVALGVGYSIKRFFTPSPLAAIPGPPSPSFLTGHYKPLVAAPDSIHYARKVSEEYGGVVRLSTGFKNELLYITDPTAVGHILREGDIWPRSPFIHSVNVLVFGPGLLSTKGAAHQRQRKMLNPVFATSHLAELMPVFYTVSYQLRDALLSDVQANKSSVDVIHWLTRVALELVGEAGLGHSFGALQGQFEDYVTASKDITPAMAKLHLMIPLLPTLLQIGSASFRKTVFEMLPFKAVKNIIQVTGVMYSTVDEIFEEKKHLIHDNGQSPQDYGHDLMAHLLQANARASEEEMLSEDELRAQLGTLLWASADTTASATSRVLHLLAMNPEIQDRLRAEICEARHANNGQDLSLQTLSDLPYLSAVIRETLRVHPPVATLSRTSQEDDVIPLLYPITSSDNTQLNSVIVPKGTVIRIGLTAINTSTKIWGPDAAEWIPERWLKPLPASVVDAKIPGIVPNLVTFTTGSQSCIGYKFALQEMKVVLSVLLESFKFTPDVDIEWRMGMLMGPYVAGHYGETRLPLNVEYIGA